MHLVNSPEHALKFGMCCVQGKVQVQPPEPIPQPLHHLYTSGEPDAKAFRENVRYKTLACTCSIASACACCCSQTCRCRWMTARRSMACLLTLAHKHSQACGDLVQSRRMDEK